MHPSLDTVGRRSIRPAPSCEAVRRWLVACITGLLDGEGSIVARGAPEDPAGHVRYLVSIAQKDSAPLEWVRDVVGAGAIHFAQGTHRFHLRG